MNCQMTQITVTYRDGRVAQLENVYIRGSKIRFLILPDMLKNAPMFKRQHKAGTAGRGKSAILRAQGRLWKLFDFVIVVVANAIILAARGRGRGANPAMRGGRGGSWQAGPGQAGVPIGRGGR